MIKLFVKGILKLYSLRDVITDLSGPYSSLTAARQRLQKTEPKSRSPTAMWPLRIRTLSGFQLGVLYLFGSGVRGLSRLRS